jgi:TatD DNase family protein
MTRPTAETPSPSLPVIDSHCHLEPKDFGEERDEIVARARRAGLRHFVVIGAGDSLANVDNAVALAEANADMTAAIGIHPHDVARMAEGTMERIEALAATHPRVVAVGETGLDYHYNYSPPEIQQDYFRRFIQLARRTRKTLTLHIRDGEKSAASAQADARRILVEEGGTEVPVVVHCFTGTPADARAWLDLGAYISFSGIVTFKTATALRESAALAPADRLLVETDCPYLAPMPYRGKRNEPAYVVETLKVVAATRGVPVEEFAEVALANTIRAFGLPT